MKTIKVAKVGSKVVEVVVSTSAQVSEILAAAGISKASDETIFVDHIVRPISYSPYTGSVVILEKEEMAEGMRSLISFLIDEEALDGEYSDDDYEEIDFVETYRYNKDYVDELVRLAKEV